MANTRFKITPFKNPSGSTVYRVSGTLDGRTIRKNFKTRKAATDCQQHLEIKYLEQESEGQTVWTTSPMTRTAKRSRRSTC